jgi:hypothetical protein
LPGNFRRWGLVAALLLTGGLCALSNRAAQQDRVSQFRARFDKESDPVRKAKLMVPLGTAEFDRIEKQVADNDLSGALAGSREYEGQASSCEKALDARGVSPEKHPAGYKELQISVRESLRRLDNVMVNLASDDQKPFKEVRSSLDALDRDLIKELFPKQPGAAPGSGKSGD